MVERILVGMSGGVDSAAAAVLLLRQGARVAGCTLRLRGGRLANPGQESGEREIEDARRVCSMLDIPHKVLDLSDSFCRQVVDPFVAEYREGRTPNPCVLCNRTIKFGGLLDYARKQGYEAIATGHYVRRSYDEARKRWQLFRADSGKDQSYVLYGLSQEQLAHIRFPLCGLEKEEVRRIARESGLPVAEKEDSMEICFVPDGEHAAFIRRYTGRPDRPGYFIAPDGRRLAPHQGISRYTIGQRKGLGVSLGRPAYVSAIRAETDEVQLSFDPPYSEAFRLSQVNYVSIPQAEAPFRAQVKIRYQAPLVDARILPLPGGRAEVRLKEPQKAVTPGQSAVFYEGDCLLGGGVIDGNASLGR